MADTAKLRELLPDRTYTPLGFFAREDGQGRAVRFDSQQHLIEEAQRRHQKAAERGGRPATRTARMRRGAGQETVVEAVVLPAGGAVAVPADGAAVPPTHGGQPGRRMAGRRRRRGRQRGRAAARAGRRAAAGNAPQRSPAFSHARSPVSCGFRGAGGRGGAGRHGEARAAPFAARPAAPRTAQPVYPPSL